MMAAFIFTGDIALSGAVGLGDFVIKTIVYYVHERVWANIAWGRSHQHGKENTCTD
jgi:uncharacterized membrane protein